MKNLKIEREVEIGRIHTVLKRMSSSALKGFQTYAFGSTHVHNFIKFSDISAQLDGLAELIYEGSSVKGIWRFVPLPKPRDFAFIIHDRSCIFDLFQLLESYLLISFVFVKSSEKDKVISLLTAGDGNPYKLEPILSEPFILHTFDLDAVKGESGMMENVILSRDISENIKSLLGIR